MQRRCLAFVNFFVLIAAAQNEPWLSQKITEAVKLFNAPGIAVGMTNSDGKALFKVVHGLLSVDSMKPVDEHSLFRIGSISKNGFTHC